MENVFQRKTLVSQFSNNLLRRLSLDNLLAYLHKDLAIKKKKNLAIKKKKEAKEIKSREIQSVSWLSLGTMTTHKKAKNASRHWKLNAIFLILLESCVKKVSSIIRYRAVSRSSTREYIFLYPKPK